jgi:rubrerythrin
MHFSGLRDIIDFAVEREEESACFYAQLREQTDSPSLKKLLEDMEKEEKHHKKLLQGLSKQKIDALTVKPVTDLKISDYLVPEPPNPEMSFQDLLILAARKEQKSADLYAHLRDRVSGEEPKKLFEFLIMQEKTHKLKLESEYEKRVLTED